MVEYLPSESEILDYAATNDGRASGMGVLARRVYAAIASARPRRVSVQVVDIRGGKVRLGFIAGDEISINRREVSDAIKRQAGAVPAGK